MTRYSTRKALKRRASKKAAAKARNLRRMREGRDGSTAKLISFVTSVALVMVDLLLLSALIGRLS